MAFVKKRIRIICPESGSKILYPSYESAKAHLEDLKSQSRHPENLQFSRIYYCKACGGYHTTTTTENRLNRMSPKARAETIRLQHAKKYSLNKSWAHATHSSAIKKDAPPPVVPGRIYRHFKGEYYQALTTARHTETNEALVIYQLVYHEKKKVWARPFKEFISEVDHEKYPNVKQKYRFDLKQF